MATKRNPYLSAHNKKVTPQSEPIPGSAQVANSAGGFAWDVGIWKKAERFLILGTEGGTYYVGERELTRNGVSNLLECIKQDGKRLVDLIVDVSVKGRAYKNDPEIGRAHV